jgi:hypothetical protein
MRRTKEWWARKTQEERSYIVYYERNQNKHYGYGGMIPDDCTECSICGTPCLSSPCNSCFHKYEQTMGEK